MCSINTIAMPPPGPSFYPGRCVNPAAAVFSFGSHFHRGKRSNGAALRASRLSRTSSGKASRIKSGTGSQHDEVELRCGEGKAALRRPQPGDGAKVARALHAVAILLADNSGMPADTSRNKRPRPGPYEKSGVGLRRPRVAWRFLGFCGLLFALSSIQIVESPRIALGQPADPSNAPAGACAERLSEYVQKLEQLFRTERRSSGPYRHLNKQYFPLGGCGDEIYKIVVPSVFFQAAGPTFTGAYVFSLDNGAIGVGFTYSPDTKTISWDHVDTKLPPR